MAAQDQSGAGRRAERGWRIAFLVLATVGVCLSADLIRLHVNVHTDPDYQSYCAMSEHVNCETVAASDYAVFLDLPVAWWGLLGYLGLGGLAIWGLRPRRRLPCWPFGVLFWASGFSSALGVVLFVISHYVIESLCLVCGLTYVVNVGLLVCAAADLRARGSGPVRALLEELRSVVERPGPVLVFGGAFLALAIGGFVAYPRYWHISTAEEQGLPVGETAAGLHWIGGRQAEIEIVEFSDYQCPHCRRGHDQVRELVRAHLPRVRLIHRHYPLDHHCNPAVQRPFHPEACEYAKMAHCAGRHGKFWAANDYLYEFGRDREPISVPALAASLGLPAEALASCVRGEEARRVIEADLAAGREWNVRGTPTFVLEGRAYPGRIPEEVLRRALGDKPRSARP